MSELRQDTNATPARPSRHRHPWTVPGWLLAAMLLLGAIAWFGDGDAGAVARQEDPSARATATREAEQREVAALQTEVAALQTEVAALQTEVAIRDATPTPTVEPTPVPPKPTGQPLAYGDDWVVTVVGVTPRPAVEDLLATGIFLEVTLTITNNGSVARPFSYLDLVLVDGQNRTFVLDPIATTRLDVAWGVPIQPSLPEERRLIFDVLPDAGPTFVLESTADPTFRVEVSAAARG